MFKKLLPIIWKVEVFVRTKHEQFAPIASLVELTLEVAYILT